MFVWNEPMLSISSATTCASTSVAATDSAPLISTNLNPWYTKVGCHALPFSLPEHTYLSSVSASRRLAMNSSPLSSSFSAYFIFIVSPLLPRIFIFTHPAMFCPKSTMNVLRPVRFMLCGLSLERIFMFGAGCPRSSPVGIEALSALRHAESS